MNHSMNQMKIHFLTLLIILSTFVPWALHKPGDASQLPRNVLMTPVEGPTQTQVKPTSTPTLEIVATIAPPTDTPEPSNPTRTPKPTSTPIATPPPADPGTINMMIIFGVIAVIVIIIGVWINRQRTF
jgi:hypothetical protein